MWDFRDYHLSIGAIVFHIDIHGWLHTVKIKKNKKQKTKKQKQKQKLKKKTKSKIKQYICSTMKICK